MMTPEDVLAIFAEQQALEAKIIDQCVTIARIAKPFAEWGTIWESRCMTMVEKLTDLLTMTQRLIEIHDANVLARSDWEVIEEKIEDTIIATVAYKRISGSFKESDLHQRLRLSKKYKEIDAKVKKAIDACQQWRVMYIKKHFNEDFEAPRHLSLVTEEQPCQH